MRVRVLAILATSAAAAACSAPSTAAPELELNLAPLNRLSPSAGGKKMMGAPKIGEATAESKDTTSAPSSSGLKYVGGGGKGQG